jgi:hypothetical protein
LLESSDPANAHRGMGSLRRVVLAWTVRSPNECATFAEQLWNIRQNNPFDAFEVSIHVTQVLFVLHLYVSLILSPFTLFDSLIAGFESVVVTGQG